MLKAGSVIRCNAAASQIADSESPAMFRIVRWIGPDLHQYHAKILATAAVDDGPVLKAVPVTACVDGTNTAISIISPA